MPDYSKNILCFVNGNGEKLCVHGLEPKKAVKYVNSLPCIAGNFTTMDTGTPHGYTSVPEKVLKSYIKTLY